MTPKKCIRHTRERCCDITTVNADRVPYSEVPQTLPLTPMCSRSLPLPIQPPPQSRLKGMASWRRSASRMSELGTIRVSSKNKISGEIKKWGKVKFRIMKPKSFYQEKVVMRKCVYRRKDVKKDIVHNHKSLSWFFNLECKTYFNFICLIHFNISMHHS